MALRVGHRGPRRDIRAEQELLNTSRWIVDRGMVRFDGQGMLSGFPVQLAANSEVQRTLGIRLFGVGWGGVGSVHCIILSWLFIA